MRVLEKLRSNFNWIDVIGQQITDPVKFRRFNGWLVLFWLVMFPVVIITGLVDMLWFVTIISVYANLVGHLGAWAASRSEARQIDVE